MRVRVLVHRFPLHRVGVGLKLAQEDGDGRRETEKKARHRRRRDDAPPPLLLLLAIHRIIVFYHAAGELDEFCECVPFDVVY